MRHPLALALTVVAALAAGCGDDGPTSPSGNTPPAATTTTLTGTVTSAANGAAIAGATISGLDGTNAGRSTTTNASGQYTLTVVTGNTNFAATAPGFGESRKGITVSQTGANALSFTLTPAAPFAQAGTGNLVFDKPAYVTRVRITGRYTGFSSNFIIWCGTQLVVNELLGTGWGPTTYDGTHATPSCTQVEIRNSTGVQWTVTEVR